MQTFNVATSGALLLSTVKQLGTNIRYRFEHVGDRAFPQFQFETFCLQIDFETIEKRQDFDKYVLKFLKEDTYNTGVYGIAKAINHKTVEIVLHGNVPMDDKERLKKLEDAMASLFIQV